MGPLLRRLAVALLVAGLATSLIAVLGLVLGWGDSTTRAAVAAPPPTVSPSGHRPTSAPSSSSSQPPADRPGKRAAFFVEFERAVRSGDTGFLVDRLHPEVIKRYGRAQCRGFVVELADPTAKLRLGRVTGPTRYEYSTDGMTASVSDTYTFHVTGTAAGTTGPRDYHFALVDGRFRSFADCGTPKG